MFQENNNSNNNKKISLLHSSQCIHAINFLYVIQIKCKHNVQIWKFISFITHSLFCFVYALYWDIVPLVFTITNTFIKYSFLVLIFCIVYACSRWSLFKIIFIYKNDSVQYVCYTFVYYTFKFFSFLMRKQSFTHIHTFHAKHTLIIFAFTFICGYINIHKSNVFIGSYGL